MHSVTAVPITRHNRWPVPYLLAVLLALLFLSQGNLRAQTIYPPAGRYIKPYISDFNGNSYLTTDPVIATYYFFWYSVLTGEHIANPNGSDSLTDHPIGADISPVLNYRLDASAQAAQSYLNRPPARYLAPPIAPPFAYQSSDWHAQQMHEITSYYIDMILPIYWGLPGTNDWNHIGLRALDAGMDALEIQNHVLPKVGLFFDTSIIAGWNLSDPTRKELFYEVIRDFYSLVKPKRWARFNNRVPVWLYTSYFPAHIDSSVFSYASNRFAQDFGGKTLFFVGDTGWRNAGCPVDLIYGWGGAVSPQLFDVTAIGPGFNNAAAVVFDNRSYLYADRGVTGNKKLARDWVTAHQHGRPLIALETWNEYHEGTGIAPTVEWGYTDYHITWPETQRHHFFGYFVKQAYLYLLGRLPDSGGNINWIAAAFNYGMPFVRDNILNSPEARGHISNAEYLKFLFTHYLHRNPNSSESQSLLNALNTGTARSTVRDGLLNSAEARQRIPDARFVTECFYQLLGREPDTASYNTQLQKLSTGTQRSVLRDSLLNSVEIRSRDLSILSAYDRKSLFDFAGWPLPQKIQPK